MSNDYDASKPPDWSKLKGPKWLFLVPENVQRPLFLIHDPLLGAEIPLEDGWKVYRFDDSGVLRIRWYGEMPLRNHWIRAQTSSGHELEASWSGRDQNRDFLSVSYYRLDEYGGDWSEFEDPNWIKPAWERLRLRGFTDLERTPEHQVLISADPSFKPKKGSQIDRDPLPQFASDARPTPRFIVPDGYSGSIYLITDPRRGSPPRLKGEEEIYDFPEDGLLRVQMTEEMSRNPAWPLVFERSGAQLWLRVIRSSSGGFKHLPIQAFLVCRTGTDAPKVEGLEAKTPFQQLVDRGVQNLKWE